VPACVKGKGKTLEKHHVLRESSDVVQTFQKVYVEQQGSAAFAAAGLQHVASRLAFTSISHHCNSAHAFNPELACHLCLRMDRELLLACSFASTENYLILMVWPCIMDPLRMMINRSVFHDLQWRPENGVKLHVVDKRKGGKGHVATYRYSVATQLLRCTELINSIAMDHHSVCICLC